MAFSAFQKSTNVRVIRGFFRVTELAAPRVAARAAARIWFTLPPAPRSHRVPAGGVPFEVESQRRRVRGTYWGEGPAVYRVHGWGGRGSQLSAYVDPLVDRGFRVVMFDGLSHGDSDAGPSGARSSTGVELGRSLDAVAAKFGPARAVVAHSMGAASTMLTLKYGWLGTERLVLVAPMSRAATQLDGLQRMLGIGRRTRRHLDALTGRRVGIPVQEFDVSALSEDVVPVPTLVVHDRRDRETAYHESVDLVSVLPAARLVTTDGLGHRRILQDAAAVRVVVDHVADARAQELLPASA